MQRTILPRSGIEISRVGLGLSRIHHLVFESDRRRLIDRARDLGITHFDVARLYADGMAERTLGRALRSVRSSITIGTKFGLLPQDWLGALGSGARPVWAARPILRRLGLSHWPRRSFTADTMRRSLERSLRCLQTDYIDVYFLHEARLSDLEANQELLDALLRAKQAGLVRALGVAGGMHAEIHGRFPGVFDVIQMAERDWNGRQPEPDITFGVLSAANAGGVAGRAAPVGTLVENALARRPRGAVLFGTSKLHHLDLAAQISWPAVK